MTATTAYAMIILYTSLLIKTRVNCIPSLSVPNRYSFFIFVFTFEQIGVDIFVMKEIDSLISIKFKEILFMIERLSMFSIISGSEKKYRFNYRYCRKYPKPLKKTNKSTYIRYRVLISSVLVSIVVWIAVDLY